MRGVNLWRSTPSWHPFWLKHPGCPLSVKTEELSEYMKMIRPVLVFSLIFAIGFFSSCKKIKETLKADFDYEAAPITLTIPAVPDVLGDIELTQQVAMDLDAIIRKNAPLVSVTVKMFYTFVVGV